MTIEFAEALTARFREIGMPKPHELPDDMQAALFQLISQGGMLRVVEADEPGGMRGRIIDIIVPLKDK